MSNSSAPIYVVVKVTHDYYRFQENILATTSLVDAEKAAAEAASLGFNGRIVWFDDKRSIELSDNEEDHIFIEKFT